MSRLPIATAAGGTLVTVRIAHARDASADEDRCDRREYWLSSLSGDALVAVDCETQWGADNPGPAVVRLQGASVNLRYVEFQSGDRCEIYTATVDATVPRVEAQTRAVGSVVKNACVPGKQRLPPAAVGDGSAKHPLLTLHRG